MPLIKCESIYGHTVEIPQERLTFRPSVYGVIVQADKVLLISIRSSNKYDFPGGGIELGETVEAALKREIREETGLEVEVVKFLHFAESFFYYDPTDTAWQTFQFFYLCRPTTFQLLDDAHVNDEEAERPRWMEVQGLNEQQFRPTAGRVLQMLQQTEFVSDTL